jgi:hypothetical protein
MGFRNPITSAEAVDTGHGVADAGVRLYQDTSTPVPRGIAEWRTGQMQRNATISLSGGGSGGSSYVIDGGSDNAVDAPTVQLNVEGLGAGGYGPVARLTNASRLQLPGDQTVALALNVNGIYAAAPAPTFSGVFAEVRDGDAVTLRGGVTNGVSPFSAGAGSQFTLGSFPSAIAPAVDEYYVVSLESGGSHSGATLIVRGTASGAPGRVDYIGWVTLTTGFLLSLNNVRWRIGA